MVFAPLYCVTFWTKIIQKEVEGGEERTSATKSVKPEELYIKKP